MSSAPSFKKSLEIEKERTLERNKLFASINPTVDPKHERRSRSPSNIYMDKSKSSPSPLSKTPGSPMTLSSVSKLRISVSPTPRNVSLTPRSVSSPTSLLTKVPGSPMCIAGNTARTTPTSPISILQKVPGSPMTLSRKTNIAPVSPIIKPKNSPRTLNAEAPMTERDLLLRDINDGYADDDPDAPHNIMTQELDKFSRQFPQYSKNGATDYRLHRLYCEYNGDWNAILKYYTEEEREYQKVRRSMIKIALERQFEENRARAEEKKRGIVVPKIPVNRFQASYFDRLREEEEREHEKQVWKELMSRRFAGVAPKDQHKAWNVEERKEQVKQEKRRRKEKRQEAEEKRKQMDKIERKKKSIFGFLDKLKIRIRALLDDKLNGQRQVFKLLNTNSVLLFKERHRDFLWNELFNTLPDFDDLRLIKLDSDEFNEYLLRYILTLEIVLSDPADLLARMIDVNEFTLSKGRKENVDRFGGNMNNMFSQIDNDPKLDPEMKKMMKDRFTKYFRGEPHYNRNTEPTPDPEESEESECKTINSDSDDEGNDYVGDEPQHDQCDPNDDKVFAKFLEEESKEPSEDRYNRDMARYEADYNRDVADYNRRCR